VLELGAGTGEISIPLAGLVDRVTAVEPSAAMLEVARAQPGFEQVDWFRTSAEDFDYDDEYGLIVCAQCLGWMDWGTVFPGMTTCLHPKGSLVIVEQNELSDPRWQHDLRALISRYSTNQDFAPFDLVEGLIARRLFVPAGSRETLPMPFKQLIDDFVDSIHARNGFSRDRMSPAASAEFDEAVRNLLLRHHPDGEIQGKIRATITWGDPMAPLSG
jgi:SAM-dependent methyltransferase